jgi:hypothetical protein
MKKSILGSFVGIAIVVAFDSFARVIISLYMNTEILMIAYSSFPGLVWPLLLTFIAGFAAFFGAMFSLTYGRSHLIITGILYLILISTLRYGQLHLLIGQETLFYPITALFLSIVGAGLAWYLVKKNKPKAEGKKHHDPASSAEETI